MTQEKQDSHNFVSTFSQPVLNSLVILSFTTTL